MFGKLVSSSNGQIRLHKLNQIIGSETSITDSEWINLVAVKEMNSIKIYKNGILIQTTDLSNFVSVNNTSFPFVIGSSGWGNSNYFKGKIDDLGVWNRTLTQAEITALYNSTLSISSDTYNYSINIYPNPVVNILNVKTDSNLINQPYSIIDGLGRVVLNGKLNEVESTINVEQLSKGIYYLKIAGNSASKFIKE